MRAIKLLLFVFIFVLLINSSLAAIQKVTYESHVPLAKIGNSSQHTLPYFNSALGKLFSIDINATLNYTVSGKAENLGGNPEAETYMHGYYSLDMTMLDGSKLAVGYLDYRVPETGYITPAVPAYDGVNDFAGDDTYSFNVTDNTSKDITYPIFRTNGLNAS